MHDVSNIWRVPLMLESQSAHKVICAKLGLPNADKLDLGIWKLTLADRWDSLTEEVNIALIGEGGREDEMSGRGRRAGQGQTYRMAGDSSAGHMDDLLLSLLALSRLSCTAVQASTPGCRMPTCRSSSRCNTHAWLQSSSSRYDRVWRRIGVWNNQHFPNDHCLSPA